MLNNTDTYMKVQFVKLIVVVMLMFIILILALLYDRDSKKDIEVIIEDNINVEYHIEKNVNKTYVIIKERS